MAAAFPDLSESDIERWTGATSLARGKPYARGSAVFNRRRTGSVLNAQCQGNMPSPYRLEVTLGPGGILNAGCSCPVGAGGGCKHVAALLLTWLDEPESYVEVEPLETALERRSKEELIWLVQQMISREPDLAVLLELPPPGKAGTRPVDPEVIRRQAKRAFHDVRYDDWGAAGEAADQLLDLTMLGDSYAAAQDWASAAVVYSAVADETLSGYEEVHDETGRLHEVVNQCVSGLSRCRAAVKDDREREDILRALYEIYCWDIAYGGIAVGEEAPGIILNQALPDEKKRIAGWVRAHLPKGDSRGENYRRAQLGAFLLDLELDTLDDESFLRICRETGRTNDLVDRLLQLGRVDEAVQEAQGADDYTLLGLADIFEACEQAGLAEKLVRERLPERTDSRLLEWLKRRVEARENFIEALSLAQSLFWHQPTLHAYKEVRRLAQAAGQWEALRPSLLEQLAGQERYALLVEIHLKEEEIDAALQALQHLRQTKYGGWSYDSLAVQVARAAERERPRDAIRLYMRQVTRLIEARGRSNYASAAGYLERVHDLHQRLGEQQAWHALIRSVREENRTLRALQDELKKKGL